MEAKDAGAQSGQTGAAEEQKTATNKKMPHEVVYCPNCTFPAEFCEYSSCYNKCKPWLQEHYPHLVKADSEIPQQEKAEEKPAEEGKTDQKPEEGAKPVKKVEFKEEKVLELTVKKRGNKKFLTLVSGLELFGVNPKDAAKKFGKKFACGSSVVENNAVEIQGDVTYDLMEYIPKEFPDISEDVIVIKETKATKKE